MFRKKNLHEQLPQEKVKYYLQMYGRYSWSYLLLNRALFHYEMEDVGIVAYAWTGGLLRSIAVILCDPLCSDENMEVLLTNFHMDVSGVHIYLIVSKFLGDLLMTKFGFHRTQSGKDFYCDFDQWKPPKKHYKEAMHRASKAGLTIREQTWDTVDDNRVREISDMWRKGKATKRELQFINWPIYFGDEWLQRKFYVYNREGTMIAYIWWWPCWQNQKIIGYTAQLLRRDTNPDLHVQAYVLDYAFYACSDIFKKEGISFITPGGALTYDVQKEPGDSFFIRFCNKFAYKFMNRLYSLKGLALHKERYKANRPVKMYTCHKGIRGLLCYPIIPWVSVGAIPHVSRCLFGTNCFRVCEEEVDNVEEQTCNEVKPIHIYS